MSATRFVRQLGDTLFCESVWPRFLLLSSSWSLGESSQAPHGGHGPGWPAGCGQRCCVSSVLFSSSQSTRGHMFEAGSRQGPRGLRSLSPVTGGASRQRPWRGSLGESGLGSQPCTAAVRGVCGRGPRRSGGHRGCKAPPGPNLWLFYSKQKGLDFETPPESPLSQSPVFPWGPYSTSSRADPGAREGSRTTNESFWMEVVVCRHGWNRNF